MPLVTLPILSIRINESFCCPQMMCCHKVTLQSLTVLTCSKYYHKCSVTWARSEQDNTVHFAGKRRVLQKPLPVFFFFQIHETLKVYVGMWICSCAAICFSSFFGNDEDILCWKCSPTFSQDLNKSRFPARQLVILLIETILCKNVTFVDIFQSYALKTTGFVLS